jgi:hypothetical protein
VKRRELCVVGPSRRHIGISDHENGVGPQGSTSGQVAHRMLGSREWKG